MRVAPITTQTGARPNPDAHLATTAVPIQIETPDPATDDREGLQDDRDGRGGLEPRVLIPANDARIDFHLQGVHGTAREHEPDGGRKNDQELR